MRLRTAVALIAAAASIAALVYAFARVATPASVREPASASVVPARATQPLGVAQGRGTPATWIGHDVMVAYRNLPYAYSCDALWHKVGDILRAAGAWDAVSITPYDCKPGTRGDGRSPQLEVRFLTLRTLSPQQARWAEARVVRETVLLAPGSPQSLTRDDCELLEQTNERLLSVVASLHVTGRPLECTGPAARGAFSLSVATLEPVKPQSGRNG
ncbi:MAG TPA: hypothetical protein VMU67_13460 [Steroidobacteraceae bacterium]|nr:hypothetical protein [Steroidobacteraceae bacterium]